MGTPYLSEVRIFSFNFPPKGWAFCNGQTLPINQNQALFSLLGTMYGGNGQTTFLLPNLQGRLPLHFGAGFTQGQAAGEAAHTVTVNEMASHTHVVGATPAVANNTKGSNADFASTPSAIYSSSAASVPMDPQSVTNGGGGQAHNNMMPFLTLNFCIALTGIFPSRN